MPKTITSEKNGRIKSFHVNLYLPEELGKKMDLTCKELGWPSRNDYVAFLIAKGVQQNLAFKDVDYLNV